jgi:hypothetical protein
MAPQYHAEIFEILRREPRQRVPIDFVLVERGRIALQAQSLQPRRYIHEVILTSEEGSSSWMSLGFRSLSY